MLVIAFSAYDEDVSGREKLTVENLITAFERGEYQVVEQPIFAENLGLDNTVSCRSFDAVREKDELSDHVVVMFLVMNNEESANSFFDVALAESEGRLYEQSGEGVERLPIMRFSETHRNTGVL